MDSDLSYEIIEEHDIPVDMSYKIILIGDSGVGKSCLTIQGTKNTFTDTYNTTVGFDYSTFAVKINDKVIKLQIWDTCGQEIYRSLMINFYRSTSLAIIVYSITEISTFNHIDTWLKELKTNSSPKVKVILIGNKVDLEANRTVYTHEGEKLSKDNEISLFLETSAKTGLNSKEIFIQAAKMLYKEFRDYQAGINNQTQNSTGNGFPIPSTENGSQSSLHKKSGGCCS